jgi:opacity protein-like surface antigen
MKRIKLIVLACCSLATITSTLNAHAAIPLPLGWYLEANAGEPDVSDVNYANNTSNTTTGLGWNINAGYKFMPFFALEGGYTNYATTNIKFDDTKVAKATSQSYDIVGKAMLPIQNSGFEFMAKVGVGRAKTHIVNTDNSFAVANGVSVNAGTNNSTTLMYGAGGEYAATTNILVNAQWMRSDGGSGTGSLDLYSIGLAYLFN